MNTPDLAALRLPREEGGPVFAEPWEAQAFALAVKLSEAGHFTWTEWAHTLAEELQAAADRGEPGDGAGYYRHWLAALERLVMVKGLTNADALSERQEQWAEAYRQTPHGEPVELVVRSHGSMNHVMRDDGVTKRIRLQDGHLFVCMGCCCGRVDKGFPALPLEEFKREWKRRGIRRRFHLTISGCLGPCSLANVILIQFHGQSVWLHSINSPDDVGLVYDYVEQMLASESYLDPPAELARRHFRRYTVDTQPANSAQTMVWSEAPLASLGSKSTSA